IVKLRITILKDNIYSAFIDTIIKSKKINIDKKEFEITNIIFAQSSKSRYSRIDEIESLEYNGKSELEKITVRFISPTFFKKNKTHIVIPDMGLILKSIVKKYNSIISEEYNIQNIEEIAERIQISYLNIKTKTSNLKKIDLIGFTGRIVLELKNLSLKERKKVYKLFRFAYYSGVGAKTAFGFGQITN
ncbi:MAG: CRISPR-associated endoribonuclease Cas6, partial [Candidatus Muirbacterium halophilum]|nr:CRISPR-associated endoribonuclease Cas6 [Candidatus Muirbacterium halophilum]